MSHALRGSNGRYSDEVVNAVLAQVAWDKEQEALRQISPEEHVERYIRKLVGDSNLRKVAINSQWYPPGVKAPDYVFTHVHSRHTGPTIEWLRIYRDPTFNILQTNLAYADSRVEGGVRLTLDVPHVGTVTIEVHDVSDGHMSNW